MIQQSESRFRELFSHYLNLIYVFDPKGTPINPKTGLPEIPPQRKIDPKMRSALAKVFNGAHNILDLAREKGYDGEAYEAIKQAVCDLWEEEMNNIVKKFTLFPPIESIQSALYATRDMEPRPNHAAASDILGILAYPHKWREYGIELNNARITHSNDRYVQYELVQTDSTGNSVPITPEDFTNYFDWIDHKISSVLLMRSCESDGGKFILSLNWLADLITDNRKVQPLDSSGNRKYLTRMTLLEDLERRIRRLGMLYLQVKWHEGKGKRKKNYNLLRQEGSKEIEFALYLISTIFTSKDSKPQDILLEIEPGRWYQMFCKDIRQFTWIPKELFSLNTHNNSRRYALGDYILVQYRTSINNLKEIDDSQTKQPIKVLRRHMDTVLREILTPEEINYALSNRDKGWRLKNGILSDFDFFRGSGWYISVQFPEGGFKELLAGIVDFAPPPHIASEIQKVQNSFPAKKLPNSRKSPPPKKINGKQVEQARKRKKYSRDALAKLIGISVNYLGKLEREERPITPELEVDLRKHLKL